MLSKRKKVLCTNCGFMGWQTVAPDGSFLTDRLGECRQSVREDIQTGGFLGVEGNRETGESIQIQCLCNQWTLFPEWTKLSKDYTDIDTIRQSRQCLYFIKYQPPFWPDEHKELKRDKETHRAIRKASILAAIIGALIGAAAAIIVQLISR